MIFFTDKPVASHPGVFCTDHRKARRMEERVATKQANWQDIRSRYRKHWATQHEARDGRWEEYEPYYQYGWEARNDSRYHGRSWREVETELQEQWEHRHPDLPWERAHGPIRAAWEDDGPADETQNASERTIPLREEELRATKNG